MGRCKPRSCAPCRKPLATVSSWLRCAIPTNWRDFPEIGTYVCSFSFRPPAAQAAAEVLLGEAEPGGRSPVSVPGAELEA